MPKKFKGENSKAVDARLRKQAQRQEEADHKQKVVEDEYWKDDDKHAIRKQQRQAEKDQKRTEQLERKKEAQELLDQEMAQIKAAKPPPPAKVTRAQIDLNREKMVAAAAAASPGGKKLNLQDELPLEENVNRMVVEGAEARDVEEAIAVLSVGEPGLDHHPERRMKAAYAEYEQRELALLKADNPNLRLSQLKQMIKKAWMKSPENPMNQRHANFNSGK